MQGIMEQPIEDMKAQQELYNAWKNQYSIEDPNAFQDETTVDGYLKKKILDKELYDPSTNQLIEDSTDTYSIENISEDIEEDVRQEYNDLRKNNFQKEKEETSKKTFKKVKTEITNAKS